MVLSDGKIGGTYRVEGITLEETIRRRFEILGMTLHSTVVIMNKKHAGTMIIKIRGTRFAIGKGFATQIAVKEVVA